MHVTPKSIQRNSAVSIAEQLRIAIGSEIESGTFKDGRLPSEAELCARFGVSRISLRRALSELEAQGLVTRRQGMGTFVNEPEPALATMSMGSYTDQLVAGGAPVKAIERDIKLAEVIPAEPDIAALLRIPLGQAVIRLVRVFALKGQPLSLDDAYYSADLYPGFLDDVTNQTSTYALLQSRFGVRFGSADRYFGVAFVTAETAPWLDRPEWDPVLAVDKVAFDTDGKVIHLSKLQMVPSRLRVRTHATADDGGSTTVGVVDAAPQTV